MAKQTINIGTSANSKDGDIIRDAFNKTNQNFDEIYNALTDGVNFAQVNSDWTATTGFAAILNKPTIPTNTNQLTNGAGFITGTDRLVNGTNQVVIGADGRLTVPKTLYVDNSLDAGSIVGNDGIVVRSPNAQDILIGWEQGAVVNPFPEAPPGVLDAVAANIMIGYGGVSVEVNQALNGGYWTFRPDQKLKMPPGGDIIDTNGVSVLGGDVGFTGNVLYNKISYDQGIYIAPGGESTSYVYVPGNSESANAPVQLNNSSLGGVQIQSGGYPWVFGSDGTVSLPSFGSIRQRNSFIRTTDGAISAATPTVVWTSIVDNISSVKLVIQVEGDEVGDLSGWHSQACEAIISCRGYATTYAGPGGDPQMIVYGVVHTSVNPLVTFTVQRNPTTKMVEVVGTSTAASTGSAALKIHSVEMSTRD